MSNGRWLATLFQIVHMRSYSYTAINLDMFETSFDFVLLKNYSSGPLENGYISWT